MADEIRVRHYSPKTLRSYRSYVGKFQAFTKSKAPESLTTDDVKTFLTHLAVNRQVAAATQNLAFNALLCIRLIKYTSPAGRGMSTAQA